MEETTLLPCPFCQQQPTVRDVGGANFAEIVCWHSVGDPDADEGGLEVCARADTLELAVEAWNRRNPSPSKDNMT